MSRLILSNYLSKTDHIIPAINYADEYIRDILLMIQRTMIPLDIIDNKLAEIPIEIEKPKSLSDIRYDFESTMYCIYTYCTIESRNMRKRVKCGVSIPKNVFEMDLSTDIADWYIHNYMKEIVDMLSNIESLLDEQKQRIKPLKQMILNPESISKIGGNYGSKKYQ